MNKLSKRFLILLAIIIFSYFVIEMSIGELGIRTFIGRFLRYRKITLFSLVFLFSFLLVLFALLNKRIYAYVIYFLSIIALSVANYQKVIMRQEPLFPHDLKEAINFIDLFKMMSTRDQILSLILVLLALGFLLLVYVMQKHKKSESVFSNNRTRLTGFLLGLSILYLFFGVNSFNKPLDKLLYRSGFIDYKWSPKQTYLENGTVISFIKNFPGVSMDKPTEYSQENMNRLSKKYVKLADEINSTRTNDDFEDINIVYILSESLADPSRLSSLELSQTPLKYIQDESDKNAVGNLLVTAYGGGTANVEFEILTALGTEFLLPNMSLPYQNILAYKERFPSIARQTKTNSRINIAAHSYHSRFYQRRKVFKNLGFDLQIFEDDFINAEPLENGDYISDASSYKEIVNMLGNKSNLFLHFITMQNHTPYEDIFSEYPISIKSSVKGDLEVIQYYVESIRQTDIATKEFIKEIDKIEDKTIIVLYGDHLPPLYTGFLQEEDQINKYTTDFFIYSNFTDNKLRLDDITPTYYINNLVYELADVKLTPFMAFIESFNKEFNGILGNKFILKNGEQVSYEALTSEQQALVDTYIMIQYDVIEGNCYFAEMCN